MITLDHAIVLTRNLDQAAISYGRLGFALTPRGRHPALGTANHTIVFERDYLELLAVETAGPQTDRWTRRLERGEGLAMIALASDDLEGTRRRLQERGIETGQPLRFDRPVATPSGPARARFSVCFPDVAASPALPAFFCQHHTPELVWGLVTGPHPNTARGIAGLTVVASNPEALAPAYERSLGRARVHPRPGGVTVLLGAAQLWLVTPHYAATRLGRSPPPEPGPLGITITVSTLAVARQVLAANEVPFRGFAPRSILIEPTFTHGVFLELLSG